MCPWVQMSQLSEPVSIEAPPGAAPTGIMCVSVSATSEKALQLVLGQSGSAVLVVGCV